MWAILAQATNLGAEGAVAGGVVGGVYLAAKAFEWFGPLKKSGNGFSAVDRYKIDEQVAVLKEIRDSMNRANNITERRVEICERHTTVLDDVRQYLRRVDGGV